LRTRGLRTQGDLLDLEAVHLHIAWLQDWRYASRIDIADALKGKNL